MSLVHIANYFDAPRGTCTAGAALDQGGVIYLSPDGSGGRKALAPTAGAQLLAGNYGVVLKISADPFQVTASTVNADSGRDLGSRLVTIASGDKVVEVGPGAIIEYHASMLHSSLDPSRSGATPAVGAALAVKDGLWADAGAASAITTPVIGRVHKTFGTKVLVKVV